MKHRAWLAACLGFEFVMLLAVVRLGDLRSHVPAFLVLFVLASTGFILAAYFVRAQNLPVWALLAVAVVLRVPMFFTQPSLSDDVWRYIHDGRAQLAGVNPYTYAPEHPATAAYRGPEFSRINHPELPTIYPPLAQYAFRAIAWFPAPLLAWRVLLLAAELAMLLAAAVLLRQRSASVNNLALYAWHPLAIVETTGNAHVEALGVAFLVGALALAARDRQLRAGVVLAASIATKLVAAPIAFITARSFRLPFAVLATVAVLYAPFVLHGEDALGSLGLFARSWESNGSLYSLFAPLIGPQVYRLSAAAVLLGCIALLRIRNIDVIDAVAAYFLALFILAPVVHPWYLLWLLALLPLRRRAFDAFGVAALYWTVSVALAYTALHQQQVYGEWRVPGWFLLLQYGPMFVLLLQKSRGAFSITNLSPNNMNTAAKM
ncbi:MAG TPA: hypothetical protein VGD49_06975 [Longimicrobiales bacterium]